MTTGYDATLDATGLVCPEPVMLLHNRIADVPVNGVLRVIATDPSTERDIARFCQFLGHRLLEQEIGESRFVYWIERTS